MRKATIPHVRGQHVGDEAADVRHHRAAVANRLHDRGEVVVEQHDVGRLAGHIGAADPHRHPHIGGPQGRGVVHPVAGDGHHLPEAAVGLHQPQFLLRRHPGEHQPVAVLEQLAQLYVADQGQAGAIDHPHRIGHLWVVAGGIQQADLAGDRLGGEPVVAGDHRHLDARLPALAHGIGHLGRGGS
jgi:hypothetical protein